MQGSPLVFLVKFFYVPAMIRHFLSKPFQTNTILVAILIVLFATSLSACGGSSESSSESSSTNQCSSDTNAVSISGLDTGETEDCATIGIFENVGDVGGESDDNILLKEYLATVLDDGLTRANVITYSDVLSATYFETWKELLGYTCSDADTCNDLAMDYGQSAASADLLVVPTIYLVDSTYYLYVSVLDMTTDTAITRLNTTATADTAAAAMASLGTQVVEAIKDERHCLALTPMATTIDYDHEDQRSLELTALVTNLKDEAANTGTVSFELTSPEWGTLSESSVDVSSGEAPVTFTMTSRKVNTLTATYSSGTETADSGNTKSSNASLVPLCELVVSITGSRTFTVNEEPLTLFAAGSTWTYQGTSTVNGYVPLIEESDETQTITYGTGWYLEDQSATNLQAHIVTENSDGTFSECDMTGSEVGTSRGDWLLWGEVVDNTAGLQALALGISNSGRTVSGTCPNLNGGMSSFSTLATFGSDTSPVSLELEPGSTATATGNDGVSDYSYTVTIKRAVH